MKKVFYLLLIFICIAGICLFTACNESDGKTKNVSQSELDKLQEELDKLREQLDDNNEKDKGNDTPVSNNNTSMSVGDIIKFGDFEWRVLDVENDKALLISEGFPRNEILSVGFTSADDEIITWELSRVRQELNSRFYDVFSDSDKKRIADTTVITPDNPWFGTWGGNTTTDKFFLLSIEEVVQYFGDSGQLQSGQSSTVAGAGFIGAEGDGISDQYNNERVAYSELTGSARGWWLRSTGRQVNHSIASVNADGSINISGSGAAHNSHSVRPAFWLILD